MKKRARKPVVPKVSKAVADAMSKATAEQCAAMTSGYMTPAQPPLASHDQCHALCRDLTVCCREMREADARYKDRPTDENAREMIRTAQNMRHAMDAACKLNLGAPGSWITVRYNYWKRADEGAWLAVPTTTNG